MAETSRRFNFDSFDDWLSETDAENERVMADLRMARESEEWEEEQAWADHDRVFYPGEIGGVAIRPTLFED